MKFYVHKLGCPKNDVDADYISARLIQEGHNPVKTPEEAESIVVNTCGFILPAKEESINELIDLSKLKSEGQLKTIYAAGCLSQRYGDELIKEMPELDGAFGLGQLDSLAEAVTSLDKNHRVIKMESRKLGYLSWNNRFISDNYPYSYLKISDGCARACTYCSIPSIRGSFRSRPIDSIIREAEFLAENGKRELILVSQEATLYGANYEGNERPDIITLLKELDKVAGIDWIRLMYLYPGKVKHDIIDYIGGENKTLPYYDLPLQHVNSEILSKMKRQVDRPRIEKLLAAIKAKNERSVIRTTFIVGFPGETDEQFDELEQFVIDNRFERMGAFVYSAEEGTKAAEMGDQIAEDVKNERLDRLMMAQQEIVFELNNNLIGSCQSVIIDSINEANEAVGRTYADCPDIDQEVIIPDPDLSVGDIVDVEIVSSNGYDLNGKVIEGKI